MRERSPRTAGVGFGVEISALLMVVESLVGGSAAVCVIGGFWGGEDGTGRAGGGGFWEGALGGGFGRGEW